MSTIEEAREQAREALIETVARAVREDHARFCDGCSFTLGQFRRAAEVALDALGAEGPHPITDEMVEAALRSYWGTDEMAKRLGSAARMRITLEAAEGARR